MILGIRETGSRRAWNPSTVYLVALAIPTVFLLLFFLLPLANVLLISVSEPTIGLSNYRAVTSSSALISVLKYTVRTAALVTLLCLVIALPVASLLSRAQSFWFNVCLGVILLPFWTSAVIRGYGWMILLGKNGVINDVLKSLGLVQESIPLLYNNFGVVIGMVHVLLPFMLLPLISSLRQIDPSYMRAASVMGAGPFRAYIYVFLPLAMPGISAGCALVFMTALGFYITPALLGGPGQTMVSVLIERQILMVADWGTATSLATILLVVSVLIYIAYDFVTKRAGGSGVLD